MIGRLFILLAPFALFVALSSTCETPWEIEGPIGETYGHQNFTRNNEHNSLTWYWHSQRGGHWTARLWRSLVDGKMNGGFSYSQNFKTGRRFVYFQWLKEGSHYSSTPITKMIRDAGWKIKLCDGTQMEFINRTNNWAFRFGDTIFEVENELADIYEPQVFLKSREVIDNEVREKRAVTRKEYPTNIPSDQPQQQGGWVERIYDFFFGIEDSEAGRKDGIFVRFAKWLTRLGCRIRGDANCNGLGTGQGRVPSDVPVPPTPPDAEPVEPSTGGVGEAENNL